MRSVPPRPSPARPGPAAHPLAHGGGRLRAGQAAGSEERGSTAPRVPAGGRCGTIAAPRPPLVFLLLPPRLLAFASPPSAPARIDPVSRRSRPQLREPPASRRIKNPRHTTPPRPAPPLRGGGQAGRGRGWSGAERGGEGGGWGAGAVLNGSSPAAVAPRPRVHLGAHLGCPSRASPRWGEAGRDAGAPSATEKAPPARPEARPPEGATRDHSAAAMPGRAAPGTAHPPRCPSESSVVLSVVTDGHGGSSAGGHGSLKFHGLGCGFPAGLAGLTEGDKTSGGSLPPKPEPVPLSGGPHR